MSTDTHTIPTDTPLEANPQQPLPSNRSPEPSGKPASGSACAICHSTKPWGESSWCPDCGFYPKLDAVVKSNPELQKTVEDKPEVETPTGPVEEELATQWIVQLMLGIAIVIAITMAIRVLYHYIDGTRGIWTIGQVVAGFIGLCAAQIAAANHSMAKRANTSLMDAVNEPIEVWKSTFEELPQGKERLFLGAWSLTAIVSAILIIGGVNSQMIFGNTKVVKKKPDNVMAVANLSSGVSKNLQPDEEGLIESLQEEELEEPLPDAAKPLTCQIYGFMEDGDPSGVGRILLCSKIKGRLSHVATISVKRLPERVKNNLYNYLDGLRVDSSSIDTRYRGNWVNPIAAADIKFKEWSASDTMVKPKLMRLYAANAGKSSAEKSNQP